MTETIIINFAPLFFLIIRKLLKKELIVSSFVYKTSVPKTTMKIPEYWEAESCSFRKNKENSELKSGVSDSRGIVKLKSECIIDFKKKIAEITLITTRIIPGSIYLLEKKKFSSNKLHEKKIITWTNISDDSKTFGLKCLRDSFLEISKKAQKRPFITQTNKLIKINLLIYILFKFNILQR